MKRLLVPLMVLTTLFSVAFTMGASAAKSALLVCVMDPNESDALVTENLEKLGFKVTLVDHASCADENPAKFDVVVVSSTSTSGNIVNASAYLTTATPVLTWESALMDDYRYTTELGAYDYDDSTLTVKDAGHPVMAGFGKTFAPYDDMVNLHTGVPVAGKVVAELPDGKAGVIVADKGDKLMDGFVAPGRRAYIASGDVVWTSANKNGWKLFSQDITWLTTK